MYYKKIQMPREVHIGPNVLDAVGPICKDLRLFDEALVVSGEHTYDIAGRQAVEAMENADFGVDCITVGDASLDSVKQVQDKIGNASVVLGVGGGKIIDVAKLASTNESVHFISVPTTASHDGIASPMASIKKDKGSVSMQAQSPIAVVADTEIIKNSPFKLLSSGCADIVSNYTAIRDWQLSHRLTNEYYSESAASLSEMTAKLILKSAESIKEGFSHALDRIAKKPALHGEQCGVGCIMMMELQGGDWRFIQSALKAVKAPINAEGLGVDPEEVIEALMLAPKIRPDRYTILGERGLTREAAINLATRTEVI